MAEASPRVRVAPGSTDHFGMGRRPSGGGPASVVPTEGEKRFLVSFKWFSAWKEYAQDFKRGGTTGPVQKPGEIDNSFMLNEGEPRSLFAHFDYIDVPEQAWLLLHRWYGGGPVMKRKVIAYNASKTHLEVEACKKLGITEDVSKVVMWSMYAGRLNSELRPLTDIIDKSTLLPGQTILLDAKGRPERELNDALQGVLPVRDSAPVTLPPLRDPVISPKADAARPSFSQADRPFARSPSPGPGIGSPLVSARRPTQGSQDRFSLTSGSSSPALSTASSLSALLGLGPISPSIQPFQPRSEHYDSASPVASKSDPGVCGLTNLGNTCFMNSGIQCLSNTQFLTEYFLEDKHRAELNKDNPLGMKGQLATSFANLVKEMWSGCSSSVAPRDLKYKIGDFAPQFCGFHQHDSQEFLAFLLDGIHEDLNRVLNKPYVENPTPRDTRPDEIVSKESWENHKKRNDSVVVDHMHGQLKSTVVCPSCNLVSVTFDPFLFLSLPLSSGSERVIKVTVVPKTLCAVQYHVKIAKAASAGELLRQACSRANVNPSESVLIEVFEHTFEKMFDADEGTESIRQQDEIYAYHVGEPQEDVFLLCASHRVQGSFHGHQIIGFPWLFPATSQTTHKALHRAGADGLLKIMVAQGTPKKHKKEREVEENSEEALMLTEQDCIVIDWNCKGEQALDAIFDVKTAFTVKAQSAGPDSSLADKEVTIESCVSRFTTEEKLSANDPWYCPRCKKHREATKRFDLWRMPDVLVIHLKRFSYSSRMYRDKLDNLVDFPLVGLDLTRFVVGPDPAGDKTYIYDLYAVSNHMGGLGGGHYTACAKNYRLKKWFAFDDSSAYEIPESQVKSKSNYLLFFQRRLAKPGSTTASRGKKL
eukprot:m51a1_g616 putative ubiquitin carboxyl-terminal hydrolase 11 (873) ;mRNA; f:101802-105321